MVRWYHLKHFFTCIVVFSGLFRGDHRVRGRFRMATGCRRVLWVVQKVIGHPLLLETVDIWIIVTNYSLTWTKFLGVITTLWRQKVSIATHSWNVFLVLVTEFKHYFQILFCCNCVWQVRSHNNGIIVAHWVIHGLSKISEPVEGNVIEQAKS